MKKLYVQFESDGCRAVASTTPPTEPAWEICVHGEPTVEKVWGAAGAAAENGGGNSVTKLARTIALYRAVAREVLGSEPEPEVPVPVEWLWENEKRVLLSVLPREWEIRERISQTAGLIPDRSLLCHTSRSGAQGLRTFGDVTSPRPWPGIEIVHVGPHHLVRWCKAWSGVIVVASATRGKWWRDVVEPALRQWAATHEAPVIAYDRNGDWVIWISAEKAADLARFLKTVKGYRLAAARGDNLKFYRLREGEAVAVGLNGENGYYV